MQEGIDAKDGHLGESYLFQNIEVLVFRYNVICVLDDGAIHKLAIVGNLSDETERKVRVKPFDILSC